MYVAVYVEGQEGGWELRCVGTPQYDELKGRLDCSVPGACEWIETTATDRESRRQRVEVPRVIEVPWKSREALTVRRRSMRVSSQPRG